MDAIAQWITQNFSLSADLLIKALASLLVVLAVILLRPLVMALINRRTDDVGALYRWRKVTEYSTLILGLIVLGQIWLSGIRTLATYLGLVSAGLAIALRAPISNLFGWLFIVSRRPFEVGDRIEIGDVAGDVVDIRYFQFTILEIRNWVEADQSTGRVLHVPNNKVFDETLANFNTGMSYLWNEIPVTITFESDWRKAKRILQEIGTERAGDEAEQARARVRWAARRYMISYGNLTPTVYTSVSPSGVTLTLRYLCEPQERRSTAERIWEDILDAFARESDLQLAYPTQRIYYRPQEDPMGSRRDGNITLSQEGPASQTEPE
jgi:small-conductance mechanosensitive channel